MVDYNWYREEDRLDLEENMRRFCREPSVRRAEMIARAKAFAVVAAIAFVVSAVAWWLW